ncbi:hypothetical protein MTR67_030184 [Solanum verrucosum]|uniref:Histone-lysine N-methyltransferase ASHH1 n=1 Tax=Solanum verrucosum TaxID=315347 RepID=A0AAF0RDR2_SOLVR|nr:hypothetical protein MTR67_030184 [Solanum verrucosum]
MIKNAMFPLPATDATAAGPSEGGTGSQTGNAHKKLKEDNIAICQCNYDTSDPESACVERCLNVLTNTECTPGYCQCGDTCENQIFQKREYAKTKLFRTNGRGWGLLADENIKAGQFIIEYCGEVISSEAAKKRSHVYEAHEVKDTYMISLDTNYVIDSTRKGNFARFLNHSCRPNCETRKWTVLGETRLGIFAMKDVSVGMELTINYYFEWYAGATVRCLCGAANCCIFLGAKSQRFKEYNHVWKDGNDRYKVEPSNRSHKNYNIVSGSTTKMKSQRIPKWKKSRCTPKWKVKSSSRKQVIKGSTRRSHQVRGMITFSL